MEDHNYIILVLCITLNPRVIFKRTCFVDTCAVSSL